MTQITNVERVLTTLECKPADRPPAFLLGADFEFVRQFYDKVGFTFDEAKRFLNDGILFTPPLNHAIAVKLGFDIDWFTTPAGIHFDPGRPGLVSTFGEMQAFTVKDTGIPHMWYAGPALTDKDKVQAWWDLGRPERFSSIILRLGEVMRRTLEKKYDLVMFIGIPGPFENAVLSLGLGFLARLMRKDPGFLKEFTRRNLEVELDALARIAKHHPPVIMCGDDYGYNAGLQISLQQWQEFVKPRLKEYVTVTHNYGSKFVLHSCGNISVIFPDLVEIGVDGIESLQPSLNDLPALKAKFGEKIAFLGTIDDSGLLKTATPEEVRASVRESLRVLGKGGGYCPGPTNFLLDVKIENIQAMIAEIKNFRYKTKE
jgi:hypothetical protein